MGISVSPELRSEWDAVSSKVARVVMKSRHANLESILGDRLTEETYMQVVRNKILVDVQGGDVLLQIFTCSILQRAAGDEAPFLEFIQRVCGSCQVDGAHCVPLKSGCGGFGIRNFLTLFLSIEVLNPKP